MHTRTRTLTPPAQDALLRAACPCCRPWLALALDAGIRRPELLALRWADVDLTAAALTIRASKGGPRRVALSEETVAALGALPPSAPLLLDPGHLSAALDAAAEKASAEHPELRDVSWHALRATAAERRLREARVE